MEIFLFTDCVHNTGSTNNVDSYTMEIHNTMEIY